nr:penicillin-binding protein 2 [uncultured bacterium]
MSKINDKDVERLNNDGKLANYAATHDIGKLGIERYYEDVLHGQTGYEEVEVNNRGRVIRQLKEVPPQAGHDIYLTLDLKLQQYIETLLAGSRAAVVVTDPRTGGCWRWFPRLVMTQTCLLTVSPAKIIPPC